jgi:hypothetical protein
VYIVPIYDNDGNVAYMEFVYQTVPSPVRTLE